jgi:hypothetical protein
MFSCVASPLSISQSPLAGKTSDMREEPDVPKRHAKRTAMSGIIPSTWLPGGKID